MALPPSGNITMAMIAAELGISATGLSLGDSRCRALAGVPSGAISFANFYGKSSFAANWQFSDGGTRSRWPLGPSYYVTPAINQMGWDDYHAGPYKGVITAQSNGTFAGDTINGAWGYHTAVRSEGNALRVGAQGYYGGYNGWATGVVVFAPGTGFTGSSAFSGSDAGGEWCSVSLSTSGGLLQAHRDYFAYGDGDDDPDIDYVNTSPWMRLS